MDEVREDAMSQREHQLQRKQERERAHRLSKIAEQREERLRKLANKWWR